MQLDGEELRTRAESDGRVIAGLLDVSQRTRCAGSSDEQIAAGTLAAARRAVLESRPVPQPEELESAEAAITADSRTQRLTGHASRAECALILVGAVFLVAGGLGILFSSEVLFALGAIGLVLGGVMLLVQWCWRRLIARRRVTVLIDWAAGRDGQLARGLPPVGTVDAPSLWESRAARSVMAWTTAFGGLLLVILAWDAWPGFSRAIADGRAPGWEELEVESFLLWPALLITVLGAAYLLGRRPMRMIVGRRRHALEWLPTSDHARPDDDEDDADEAAEWDDSDDSEEWDDTESLDDE